jgi:hypothetical protein
MLTEVGQSGHFRKRMSSEILTVADVLRYFLLPESGKPRFAKRRQRILAWRNAVEFNWHATRLPDSYLHCQG